jgi:hypothetical protein
LHRVVAADADPRVFTRGYGEVSHQERAVPMSTVIAVLADLLIEVFGFILFAASFLFVNRL